jgi:hypothetical protein
VPRIKQKKDQDMKTKEEVKAKLEAISTKTGAEWHSQAVHKIAVCAAILDMAGIKDQAKRDAVLKAWGETPASFGCNASAMAQQCGRPKAGEAIEKAFAGF